MDFRFVIVFQPIPSTASVKLKDDVYSTPKRSRRAPPAPLLPPPPPRQPLPSLEEVKVTQVADEVYQSPKTLTTRAAGAGGGRCRVTAAAVGGIKALDGGDPKQVHFKLRCRTHGLRT